MTARKPEPCGAPGCDPPTFCDGCEGEGRRRITSFALQGDGSRSFGLTVRGVRVLVTAREDQHDAGRLLAEAIAALGPEEDPAEIAPAPVEPVPVQASIPAKPVRNFIVGQRVWCRVHGAEGFCTVLEVGTERNRGRIKITGCRGWCPIHNFDAEAP